VIGGRVVDWTVYNGLVAYAEEQDSRSAAYVIAAESSTSEHDKLMRLLAD